MKEEIQTKELIDEEQLQTITGGCNICDNAWGVGQKLGREGDQLAADAKLYRHPNQPANVTSDREKLLLDKSIDKREDAIKVFQAVKAIGHHPYDKLP